MIDWDNDISGGNCVFMYSFGWWYGNCFESNFNGWNNRYVVKLWKGIIWYFFGKIILKIVRMMIRLIVWYMYFDWCCDVKIKLIKK